MIKNMPKRTKLWVDPFSNQSVAHFTVVSEEMAPEEICQQLGIKCDSSIVKDAPNPSGRPPRHPFNMAIFRSRLSDTVEMEKHVEDLLARILPVRRGIMDLPKNCVACFHFNYKMGSNGGWRLSPSIVRDLAMLGVECLFSLDLRSVRTAEKAGTKTVRLRKKDKHPAK
jgi:hypothetical protein